MTKRKTTLAAGDVRGRAFLSSLHIGFWAGRKTDRRVTQETEARYDAESGAGNWQKILMPGALDDVQRAIIAARQEHKRLTAPWRDGGTRILMVSAYDRHVADMGTARARFDAAVKAFVRGYGDYYEAAKKKLGKTFDPKDYPKPETMPSRFYFDLEFEPLPEASGFQASVKDTAAIQADIEKRVSDRLAGANRDAWDRLYGVLTKVADKLADADAIFRDTLIGNLVDLVDLLPALNFTGDPALKATGERLKASLCKADPEQLRKDKKVRAETAGQAKKALAEVTAVLKRPTRRFDLE